jgi:hypothetical protein
MVKNNCNNNGLSVSIIAIKKQTGGFDSAGFVRQLADQPPGQRSHQPVFCYLLFVIYYFHFSA